MRHAQAARGVPDHRRPLDGRGRRQAASQAGPVSDAVGRIDLAIVSDAARTLQTLAGLKSGGLEVGRVLEERELYVADWRGLIDLLNEHPRGEETALVLGHEPTISLAARMLASGGLSARTDFGFGFSTAMAVAGTVPAWGGVAAGDLRVERVLRPSA
jgi:putative phosphohistidine phosphatase, sixA